MTQHTPDILAQVDHLVYAVPDLAEGVDHIEQRLGLRPNAGGRHPGWGTANAILGLGPGRYLEIIGPDPEQLSFEGDRLFCIDRLAQPRLVTWAAKRTQLERLSGHDLGEGESIGIALPASRKLPDGRDLSWILTDPTRLIGDGLVPFFIDWGDSPHPCSTAEAGVELVELHLEHPRPDRIRAMLAVLDLELLVCPGERPAIVASLRTDKGDITLR